MLLNNKELQMNTEQHGKFRLKAFYTLHSAHNTLKCETLFEENIIVYNWKIGKFRLRSVS